MPGRLFTLLLLLVLLGLLPWTAPASPSPSSCTLTSSGPITVDADDQVIEYKKITSTHGPAVTVNGHSGVIIRNCEIHHGGGPGISFSDAANIQILATIVVNESAPVAGKNPSPALVNIQGQGSTGVVIDGVRLLRGSSGIYLLDSPGATLSNIDAEDVRGPIPRGQCVQFDKCSGSILQDFYCKNPSSTSWTEDGISVYRSSNVTVRRGLIDGNNSPSGVGVMFEQSGGGTSGGLCQDVDAVHQGNGCFFAYPGRNVTFERVRARDNICTDQGRGAPSSGGLAWGGSPDSSGLAVRDSLYDNLCGGVLWDSKAFVTRQLASRPFAPRAPVKPGFCWTR